MHDSGAHVGAAAVALTDDADASLRENVRTFSVVFADDDDDDVASSFVVVRDDDDVFASVVVVVFDVVDNSWASKMFALLSCC